MVDYSVVILNFQKQWNSTEYDLDLHYQQIIDSYNFRKTTFGVN